MGSANIDSQLLIDFAAGILAPAEMKRVEALIASDPAAKATVQRYRLAAAVHASDDTVEPPVSVVARAKAVFKPVVKPVGSLSDAVRTVLARLIYDSRVQPAAVRGSDAQRRVQLTYAAEDVELEFQAERDLSASAGQWRVMGQFVGDDAGQRVQITITPVGASQAVHETTIEGDETFSVNLGSGRYEVRATVEGVRPAGSGQQEPGALVVVVPELVLE